MSSEEKLIQLSNDARLVNLAEQLIFPLLDNMRQRKVEAMLHKHSGGQHDYVADVAYIAALAEIRTTLLAIQARGTRAIQNINT